MAQASGPLHHVREPEGAPGFTQPNYRWLLQSSREWTSTWKIAVTSDFQSRQIFQKCKVQKTVFRSVRLMAALKGRKPLAPQHLPRLGLHGPGASGGHGGITKLPSLL